MTPAESIEAAGAAKRPRILCIGKRFYTNKDTLLERFGRVYRLPMLWSRQGANVLLWVVDYHAKEPAQELAGRVRILSAPALGMSSFKALYAALRTRPEVVVASGDCYVGLLGWLLARISGAKFVFDIYDKYDEFAGYRRLPGFDPFAFLRKRADMRLFCSQGLQAFYAGEQAQGPSFLVRNGVDESVFVPLPKDDCRLRLDLPKHQVLIGYFGSMEPDRGVGDLLSAVEILRGEGLDLALLICGKADPAMPMEQDWVIFRGMVPHDRMPLYINSCDLLAVPYRESPVMDMGASCKIAEYLMCQRPMVTTSTGNFTSNFPLQASALGAGMCPPGDVSGIARSIRFQLAEKRVLSPPADMAWSSVAASALEAIRSGVRSDP